MKTDFIGGCMGPPPRDEPLESQSNPRKVFDFLFPPDRYPQYSSQEKLDDLYQKVMAHTMGIHLRQIGDFWNVKEIEKWLNRFHEFVVIHSIPVKVTWEPRHRGGGWGVEFWGAELKDCLPATPNATL